MTLGHDTLMGVVLIIAGILTFAFTRDRNKNLEVGVIVGALATAVIGVLLLFSLA